MLHAIIITSIITCIYGGTSLPALVPVNAQTNDLPAAPANDLPAAPANAMTNDLPAPPVTALDIVNNPSMIGSLMTNPHALVSLMANEDPGKIREVVLILKGLVQVSETDIASFNKDESDSEQEKLAAAGIHEALVVSVTNLTNWLSSETGKRNTAKTDYDDAVQLHAQKETLKNREVPHLERSNQAIENAIALLEAVVTRFAPKGARPALLGDSCGGWRESTCGGLFLAAMVSNTWNTTFNYRCPDGFRWITSEEFTENRDQSSTCHSRDGFRYGGQCGWSGYVFDKVFRKYFRFSDSTLTNGYYIHSGNNDNYPVQIYKKTDLFAGIVCIANG